MVAAGTRTRCLRAGWSVRRQSSCRECPISWTRMKTGAPEGSMPAKVSEIDRVIVAAELAKDVTRGSHSATIPPVAFHSEAVSKVPPSRCWVTEGPRAPLQCLASVNYRLFTPNRDWAADEVRVGQTPVRVRVGRAEQVGGTRLNSPALPAEKDDAASGAVRANIDR